MVSSESTSNDATKRLLDENIQRTVASAALKRMRGLANEFEVEDRAARRFSRIMLVCVGSVAALLIVVFLVFGLGRMTRWLMPSMTPAANGEQHGATRAANLEQHK